MPGTPTHFCFWMMDNEFVWLYWELPSINTAFYWWPWESVFECCLLGAAQYNHSLLLMASTNGVWVLLTGSCPLKPQHWNGVHWERPSTTADWDQLLPPIPAAQTLSSQPASPQNYHRLLLVDTGSCPVPPDYSTGGHWELPSTTTVFFW